jgi:hypothetical protein
MAGQLYKKITSAAVGLFLWLVDISEFQNFKISGRDFVREWRDI